VLTLCRHIPKEKQNEDNMEKNTDNLLTELNDSILIIIDVQQMFLEKMSIEHYVPIVNRISWMTWAAVKLKVPLIVTGEDIPEFGTTVPQIAKEFPKDTVEHNKMVHGITGNPEIIAAVNDTDKKTAVLVGLETDVCVMQSALGLLQEGYRVVVLSDATASPEPCHQQGLERMRNAGVIISTVKGTFYEWTRSVPFAMENFDLEMWTEEQPKGIYL